MASSLDLDNIQLALDAGKVVDKVCAKLLKDIGALQHACHDELLLKLDTWAERQERLVDRMERFLHIGRQNAEKVSKTCLQSSGAVQYGRDYSSIDLEVLVESSCPEAGVGVPEAGIGVVPGILRKSTAAPVKNKGKNKGQLTGKRVTIDEQTSADDGASRLQSFASAVSESAKARRVFNSKRSGSTDTIGSIKTSFTTSTDLAAFSAHPEGTDSEAVNSHASFQRFSAMQRERFDRCTSNDNMQMKKIRSRMIVSDQIESDYKAGARESLKDFVGSNLFVMSVASAIVSNAVFMGIQMDYGGRGDVVDTIFRIVDVLYAFIFLMELLFRMAAEGKQFFAGEERAWNLLDSMIVITSILEVVILSSASGLNTIGILRLLRVFRIFKMLRLVKLIRIFRSLRIMIQSIFGTLKSLIWALLLLTAIMYVFALLFTSAAMDAISDGTVKEERLREFYGTVPRSMFTLYRSMSSGMDWGESADLLGDIDPFYMLMFIVYISFVCFAVLNLITGHFCHTAIESAATDMELVLQEHQTRTSVYEETLKKLFHSIDVLHNGRISLSDFRKALTQREIKDFFHSLDINVTDAWDIFKCMDQDADDGVDLNEFIIGCFQLRGPAKSVDLARLEYAVTWLTSQFGEFVEYFSVNHSVAHADPSL